MSIFFDTLAPRIMHDLMRDFDLTVEDAAAIVGNFGHETGGFKFMQELKPVVPGSRGGFGWAQWTGPRRRAFEAWCAAQQPPIRDLASYDANYGFLCEELRGPEKRAIPAVKAASGLSAKTIAFEKAFERAGIKHYDSRIQWANRAMAAFDSTQPVETPSVAPAPVQPSASETHPEPTVRDSAPKDGAAVGALAGIGLALGAAWTWARDHMPEIFIGMAVLAALVLVIYRLSKGRWPWTGAQSQGPSRPLPRNSVQSLERASAALSAASSAASRAAPLPGSSASKPLRKP